MKKFVIVLNYVDGVIEKQLRFERVETLDVNEFAKTINICLEIIDEFRNSELIVSFGEEALQIWREGDSENATIRSIDIRSLDVRDEFGMPFDRLIGYLMQSMAER